MTDKDKVRFFRKKDFTILSHDTQLPSISTLVNKISRQSQNEEMEQVEDSEAEENL